MSQDSGDIVAFRPWPPVAIGAPLLVGAVATSWWGDPVEPGPWRVPLGWALVGLEERFLHERLGASYDDYRRRVRRWL